MWNRLFKRVAYVPQMEIAECGAASLAMVLNYHGRGVSLAEMRKACAVSRDGVNALAILKAARSYGLEARGFRTNIEGLAAMPGPVILHWEFNHFLVFERRTKKGAYLVDPALGRRFVTLESLDRSFTGIALAFAPGPDFKKSKRPSRSLTRYRSALLSNPRALAMVMGSALMLELGGLVFPAANQVLIDHVLLPHRPSWLLSLALVLVAAALTRVVLSLFRNRVLATLNFALDVSLMTAFTEHLLHLPAPFLQQRSVGDLMQRVDANRTLRQITSTSVSAVLDGLLAVTYACLMLAYDAKLGAIVLIAGILRVWFVSLSRTHAQHAALGELTARGKEQATAVEAFAVPEVVKAFGAERVMCRHHEERLVQRMNASLNLQRISAAFCQLTSVFDGCTNALVLLLGGWAVIHDRMTLGVFSAFVALQGLLRAPLEALTGAVAELVRARGLLERVDDVLETPRQERVGIKPGALRGEILFDRVTFQHGRNAPVLQQVTLHIQPGEKIAIVGRSGQGKSTFIKLLTGIWKPTEGAILIDGVPVGDYDHAELISRMGIVLQESFLFDDTVRENLALFDENVSMDDLRWATRMADMEGVIRALPDGFDSRVGPGGRYLSGGQRQRLALARAIARRPSLLVLDEATSALDLETEATVHANLGQLQCTRIVIAHRLATVKDADRIVVVDSGSIVQQGTFSELVSQPGLFATLAANVR